MLWRPVRPTIAFTSWWSVGLWRPVAVTYHCWSALTIPGFSVSLYCPALSVVVCATWWKLDWPDNSRHSATVAPAAGGLLVKPPEITTFRPAVDGSGDAAIVSPPEVHGVTQQVVWAQQVPDDAGQQLVGTGQHVMTCERLFAPLVGGGQQVMTPACWGQMM
jgi:hypothetical protein